MSQENEQALAKAQAFFERAREVAQTNNFDYAIDMYFEGLRRAPDAIEDGHIRLYELARLRQSKGGKKPSMVERVKHLGGKTPLEQILNAEYLFAKDPDHLPYAEAMLKAAIAGEYKSIAKWIADYLFQANNSAAKRSLQLYLLLKDSYLAMDQLDRAVIAIQFATELKPDDLELADEYKRLSAEQTLSRGKYDQEVDFRESIKDRAAQEKLQAQQSIVKTEDYRLQAVEDARRALARNPDIPTNTVNLADALSDLQNDQDQREAIELLENAYDRTKDFNFKQRAGLVRIKQAKRKMTEIRAALEANPGDDNARAQLVELSAQFNDIELEHFRLCTENYPTELQFKYEYGIRLIRSKEFDEAIPLFQDVQKNPRLRIGAMDKIGLCFFMKGWYVDAIDVFTKAINMYNIKDDAIAKELQYNRARSYEQQGDMEKALESYRKIAQLDYGFKDVYQRIVKLRHEEA